MSSWFEREAHALAAAIDAFHPRLERIDEIVCGL
jgi:hypothetical protein